MTWLIFIFLLLLTGTIFAALRLVGARVRFETLFKVVAIAAVFLPIVVMIATLVFMAELLVCMIGLGLAHATGLLNLADIPRHYQTYGIYGLMILAFGIIACGPAVELIRYISEIARRGD
jgi:hypothetical protein